MIGYERKRVESIAVNGTSPIVVNFELAEEAIRLNEVIVTPGHFSMMAKQRSDDFVHAVMADGPSAHNVVFTCFLGLLAGGGCGHFRHSRSWRFSVWMKIYSWKLCVPLYLWRRGCQSRDRAAGEPTVTRFYPRTLGSTSFPHSSNWPDWSEPPIRITMVWTPRTALKSPSIYGEPGTRSGSSLFAKFFKFV